MRDAEITSARRLLTVSFLKEIKSVKEQIDTCPAERTDLKEEYQARYDIYQEYAPKSDVRRGSGSIYH